MNQNNNNNKVKENCKSARLPVSRFVSTHNQTCSTLSTPARCFLERIVTHIFTFQLNCLCIRSDKATIDTCTYSVKFFQWFVSFACRRKRKRSVCRWLEASRLLSKTCGPNMLAAFSQSIQFKFDCNVFRTWVCWKLNKCPLPVRLNTRQLNRVISIVRSTIGSIDCAFLLRTR